MLHFGTLARDVCFSLQMVLTVLLTGTVVMRGQGMGMSVEY